MTITWLDELGPAIREVRERRRMTQEDLGSASSCTAQHIYRIEAGRTRLSLECLETIARVLSLQVSRLLKLAEQRAQNRKKEETQ